LDSSTTLDQTERTANSESELVSGGGTEEEVANDSIQRKKKRNWEARWEKAHTHQILGRGNDALQKRWKRGREQRTAAKPREKLEKKCGGEGRGSNSDRRGEQGARRLRFGKVRQKENESGTMRPNRQSKKVAKNVMKQRNERSVRAERASDYGPQRAANGGQ